VLSKQEIYRQILHIAIGIVTILLIYFNLLTPFAIFLLILVGILASLLSKRIWLPLFSFFIQHLEREDMKKAFPGKGLIFFFIGVLLSIKLFERDVAFAAIIILTLGDSVSHVVGSGFGQLKNLFNGKSRKLFEGTLAGTIAGFCGAIFFVSPMEAFMASFVAMVAEVIQIDFNKNTLDDNLVIPLVAGTVILLMRIYL
jgi:dolichol kinase